MPTFRILGELEASNADGPVELTRAKLRALLGMLLLAPGKTVSPDHLIDAVWGEAPPASARDLVRLYVSQLREALGEGVIETRPGGYAVTADTAVDADAFRVFVDRARAARASGELEEALKIYDQGLRLWRGPVLADSPLEGEGRINSRLLEELHMVAIEERFELAIESRPAQPLVPEIEAQAAAHPERERLTALLMLALYRSGRQTDALEVYQQARKHLDDEFGVVPGKELQDLERAILRQDPTLLPPLAASTGAFHRPDRRRRLVLIGAVAAAAIVTAAIPWSRDSKRPEFRPSSLATLDEQSGRIEADLPLGAPPQTVAAADGKVQVATQNRSLVEVDRNPIRVSGTVGLPDVPEGLATAGRNIWIANGFDGTLTRVAPGGFISPRLRPEPHSDGRLILAGDGRFLWVASQDNIATRLDQNAHATATTRIAQPAAAVVANGSIWYAQATRVNIRRLDPRSGRTTQTIPLGTPTTAIASGAGSIWALSSSGGTLWRINSSTGVVQSAIRVNPDASAVVGDPQSVWVIDGPVGTLEQVNVSRNKVAHTLHVGRPISGAVLAGRQLWLAIR